MNQFPPLTEEQEKEAILKYLSGDKEAENLLINSNLRLIFSIAKKLSVQSTTLSTLDLVQEGVIGFINGLQHYNIEYGYRLNTCVVPWVRQAIGRYIINSNRNVDIPVYMVENINKYKKAQKAVENEKGENSTLNEIAFYLNWSLEKTKMVSQYLYDTISLDAKVNEEGEDTLGDIVKDKTLSPESLYEQTAMTETVNSVLDTLPERDAKILRMRFGIGYPYSFTLEEVGKTLNISKERARQLEDNALKKMRNPIRANLIKDFLN